MPCHLSVFINFYTILIFYRIPETWLKHGWSVVEMFDNLLITVLTFTEFRNKSARCSCEPDFRP